MKELDKLPMNVVMSLYRKRLSAEQSGDSQTLSILEKQYPDLFSCEFDDFISNLRMSIEDIRYKYGEDFREILAPKELNSH